MQPDASSLPPVDVSTLPVDSSGVAEVSRFDQAGKELDRGMRRVAGYGALAFAGCFYLAGLASAVHFSGLGCLLGWPTFSGSWHISTSVLVALFSVPTVLVLAVFRNTAVPAKDSETDSMHAALGSKLMLFLEKTIDRLLK